MSTRTKQLGKQAMDALAKVVLSAIADAENGECFDVKNCEGRDEHGPMCIHNIAGIYSADPRDAIVAATLRYLQDEYLVDKPRGYRLTALGRKSLDGEN